MVVQLVQQEVRGLRRTDPSALVAIQAGPMPTLLQRGWVVAVGFAVELSAQPSVAAAHSIDGCASASLI